MTNEPESATEGLSSPIATPSGAPDLSGQAGLWAILEKKLGTGRRPLYWALAYVIVLAIAASISMWWVVGHFAAAQDALNDVLKQEISVLDKQIEQVKGLREQTQALLARKTVIENLQRDRNATVLDFQTISRSVPHDQVKVDSGGSAWARLRQIYLTEIEVLGNKIVLRGESYSAGRVTWLMNSLQGGHFDGVKLLRLEPATATAGNLPSGLVSFAIEMERSIERSRNSDRPARPRADTVKSPPPPEEPDSDDGSSSSALLLLALAVGGGVILLAARYVQQRWLRRRQAREAGVSGGALSRCCRTLQSVDHANPDTWPLAVHLFVIAEVFVLVVGVSFYAVVSDEMEALQAKASEEIVLKESFVAKKKQAANLDISVEQLNEVDKAFGLMLKQLPGKFYDAGLLSDLNQAALGRGLTLQRIRPEGDVVFSEFYATQAWSIQVSGNFDDMGDFVSDIGKLTQIVTLPDYRLSVSNVAKGAQTLLLNATLRTYRYLDAEEFAKQKKAAAKAKGKK
jgi:type IV pilus assembly protein PilO